MSDQESQIANWYCYLNDQTYGPYPEDAFIGLIQAGNVLPDTLVYCDAPDMPKDWVRAGESGLGQHVQGSQPQAPSVTHSPRAEQVAPRSNANNSWQAEDDHGYRLGPKQAVAVALVIAITLVGGIAFYLYWSHEKKRKQVSIFNEYVNGLVLVSGLMSLSVAQAEEIMDMVGSIWYNAIHENRDEQTNPYTNPKPYNFVDFNRAIANYYADSSVMDNVQVIKDGRESAIGALRLLMNPPDECREAYNAVTDLYEKYSKVIELSFYPSGNLQSFNSAKNESVANFTSSYKKLEILIPPNKRMR